MAQLRDGAYRVDWRGEFDSADAANQADTQREVFGEEKYFPASS